MQGQANHFNKYAPEKIPYAIKRYQDETKRLYSVYEKQLESSDYLVGGKYSIADIATQVRSFFRPADSLADHYSQQPWVRAHNWAGVSLDGFPKLSAWVDRIEARPGFQVSSRKDAPCRSLTLLFPQAGLKIPEQDSLTRQKEDPSLGEKIAKEASAWVSAVRVTSRPR